MTTDNDAVSVVVRRRIYPHLQKPYEQWLAGITAAAAGFEGHQGAQVLRPSDPARQDYIVLFRFATPAQLAAWQGSETARDWLERGEVFTRGEARVQTLTGLEFWFARPGAESAPPPKHKMVVATVIGLFPLILILAPPLSAELSFLPGPLNVLLTVFSMVLLMTYGVMPLVVRALSPWLFRGDGGADG